MPLDLSTEFERLNPEQKQAVRSEGNTVVLAGPGSGKTDTLVIKVAHLLSSCVVAPRGLACITFNNDAVKEFQQRLGEYGIRESHRLFLGTLHSFCLNCILRAFGPLVTTRFSDGVKVAAPNYAKRLLEESIYKYIPDVGAWYAPTIMRYRRKVVCGEDVTGFDDRDPLVVQDYIARLNAEELVDFEGIIAAALEMIRTHPLVCDYLSARFPWLLVDEYQDLGGPLHQIVLSLIQQAGIKIYAVGDPDQTVYDFTGADPKYLNELVARGDFEAIRLRFNYRSGRRLIAASEIALAPSEPRNYQPDPRRKDLGEVYFEETENGYDGQAAHVAQELIPALDRQGIPREEIAILYRSKGKLFSALMRALTDGVIPYVAERDGLYPRSPFVKWLQSCAAWAISDSSNRRSSRILAVGGSTYLRWLRFQSMRGITDS